MGHSPEGLERHLHHGVRTLPGGAGDEADPGRHRALEAIGVRPSGSTWRGPWRSRGARKKARARLEGGRDRSRLNARALSRPPPLGKGGNGDRISVSGAATAHVNNYTAPWLAGQWPVLARKAIDQNVPVQEQIGSDGRADRCRCRPGGGCAFHHLASRPC